MVDTQLMLTIAQASATFVATKIILISSDKKRIESKIAEDDIKRGGAELLVFQCGLEVLRHPLGRPGRPLARVRPLRAAVAALPPA